ncbi:MAG: amino acid ABC transporter ATP-binding protein [Desulfurococcus sp.]|nr:amino acid ABC transporter ATP-binding protein [Desulfurococcus sp.]
MGDIVLRVEDLWKKYGSTEILRGVTFEVERGEVKIVMGSSGAGKSTLLRCINLLVTPDKGRIMLEGEEVFPKPSKSISSIRQRIGFVFQHFNLFMHLTALENVEIGLVKVKKLPRDEARHRAIEALKMVGIGEDLWHKYPAQLSGGQQQRVAIARAIAMEPSIILMDEPTSALDPELVGEVLRVIEKLAEAKTTMLIVTHEMDFALRAADEIMIMDNGVIVEKGPPEEIIENPRHERTRRFIESIRGRRIK